MVKKSPGRSGRTCRVTFEVPAEVSASTVHVCGDFNDWSESDSPLSRRKDGRFSATLTLEPGRRYRYRYLLDGHRWENDPTSLAARTPSSRPDLDHPFRPVL